MNEALDEKEGIHQGNVQRFLHVVGCAGYQYSSRSKRKTNRNEDAKNTSRRHGSYTKLPVK